MKVWSLRTASLSKCDKISMASYTPTLVSGMAGIIISVPSSAISIDSGTSSVYVKVVSLLILPSRRA
jgi:hypothetical protein